jgi:hypothetical protein
VRRVHRRRKWRTVGFVCRGLVRRRRGETRGATEKSLQACSARGHAQAGGCDVFGATVRTGGTAAVTAANAASVLREGECDTWWKFDELKQVLWHTLTEVSKKFGRAG